METTMTYQKLIEQFPPVSLGRAIFANIEKYDSTAILQNARWLAQDRENSLAGLAMLHYLRDARGLDVWKEIRDWPDEQKAWFYRGLDGFPVANLRALLASMLESGACWGDGGSTVRLILDYLKHRRAQS